MVNGNQRDRMMDDRRGMVHDRRMRHGRMMYDRLHHGHGMHQRRMVNDRRMVDNRVGDDGVRNQLRGGMMHDVSVTKKCVFVCVCDCTGSASLWDWVDVCVFLRGRMANGDRMVDSMHDRRRMHNGR